MEDQRDRFQAAVERVGAELQWAIIHRTSLQGISRVLGARSYFLHSAYNAMFNDHIAHCIKVFDRNSQSGLIDRYLHQEKQSLKAIEYATDKLKQIRDKTHFHIDKDAVLDPKQVWSEAGLTGNDLQLAVDLCFSIVQHIQRTKTWAITQSPAYSVEMAMHAATKVRVNE
jgi:hypothetical protein